MARDEVVYFPGSRSDCQKEECFIRTSGNLVQIYSQSRPEEKRDAMTHELSAYYKALRKHLHCPKEDKEQFLHEAKQAVEEYRGEHPDCEFSEIVQALGEPRAWAREIMAERLDPSVVYAYKKRRKRICKLFIAGSLAFIMGLSCLSFYLYHIKTNAVVTRTNTIIVEEID